MSSRYLEDELPVDHPAEHYRREFSAILQKAASVDELPDAADGLAQCLAKILVIVDKAEFTAETFRRIAAYTCGGFERYRPKIPDSSSLQ